VEATASADEIRRAYYARCLKLHPDKAEPNERSSDEFQKVQDAWTLLGDPISRATHDEGARRRTEHLEAEQSAADLVKFDEMRRVSGDAPREWPCRCGCVYQVGAEELDGGELLVQCDGCSLSIRVVAAGESASRAVQR
jgi:curved DNA-binding protein CbpA